MNRFWVPAFSLSAFRKLAKTSACHMSFEKENFLRTQLVRYMQQLDPATPPRWGKMNVQQMIEHYAGHAVRNASGRLKIEKIVTPAEKLAAMREFMMSDKPFKENTR